MSLAFHYVLGGAIDEQLLRTYASRSVANARKLRRRLKWLARLAAAAGLRKELRLVVSGTSQTWYLVQLDSTVGALLVMRSAEGALAVTHYEGEAGAERMVRFELTSSGVVAHYEGERGAERMVRYHAGEGCPTGGTVGHYKGEKDVERLVRVEHPSGDVWHFEAEKGTERLVCTEFPSGEVRHFEGERGAERVVRSELPYGGLVRHYEGEKGVEQLVLLELPYGGVIQ